MRTQPSLFALAGIAVLLAACQLIGWSGLAGHTWPPVSDVLRYLSDGSARALVLRSAGSTLLAAGVGLVVGSVGAALAACIALLAPWSRQGLDRLAAILNAIPLIALAPILVSTVGRSAAPVSVAALGVGFVMFVAVTSALESGRSSHQDVFTVLGAPRNRRLRLLELPAAIPGIVDGLCLAAPASVLGATIGEWFGADRGLGVLMISAMQNFQIPLLWAAAACATIASLFAYGALRYARSAVTRRFT